MECNKDDAIKAREIAERKFNAKDIVGAKKFAIKARKLYPGLEGISQMLATLDVYAAAENLVLGEADFYGVLGVGPQADDDTIRKQYRKLALMLHPDKNKSIGAEGAFKLISEAWSMLSDKNKKAAYDVKRNSSGFAQKANPSSVPHPSSMPTGSNGFYNFAKSTMSNPKVNKKTSHRNDSASSEANQNTFWTVCNGCKMQYEYLRSYRNQRLQCPNCLKPFFALETPPPAANHSTKPWVGGFTSGKNSQQEARIKKSNNDGYNTSSFEWTPFSGGAGVSSVAQAANVVQQTYEKVKRVREEAQAAKKLEKAMKRKRHAPDNTISSLNDKKRKVGDDASMNNNQMGRGRTVFGKSSTISPLKPCDAGSIYASRINKLNSMKELSQSELRSILMHKARKEISSKIVEWKSVSMIGNAGQEKTKEYYNKDGRQEKAAINGNSSREYSNSAHSVSQSNEIVERLSIPVPDSVFYDFDKDRTEKTFGENQVWAVYDYDDGMPRFYAMVRCVISQNPFKLRIGWLNSYSENVKLGGFSNTCGDFKVGRHETNDALNCFSHKVWWTQGPWGAIRIFPRKGDVWALYRNWSPEWNELTEDTVIHKYDLVEVLGSYDEELGVVVIPLVKVAGFKTVFHHHVDPKQVRRIPIEEIARFSYQVPSHLILGHEASNAPKGCRELDPAALPPEFLQMIADAKEDDIGENLKISEVSDSKASDKGFQGAAKSNEVIPSESQSAV